MKKVWEKIKEKFLLIVGAIAGLFIAVLSFCLKLTKRQLKKAKNEVENLNNDLKLKDKESEMKDVSQTISSEANNKIVKIQKEESETISKLDESKETYNSMVGAFNEKTINNSN